jgi:hypothetical protein
MPLELGTAIAVVAIGGLLAIVLRVRFDARRTGSYEELQSLDAETEITVRAWVWGGVFFALLIAFELLTGRELPRWLVVALGFAAILGGWLVHRPPRRW